MALLAGKPEVRQPIAREFVSCGISTASVGGRYSLAEIARSQELDNFGAVRARLAWGAAIIVAGTALFAAYLSQARTYGTDSDGAANALQAWDMLHGNVLLHGWWLSDVSFYTTELPEYILVEKVTGLQPDVVHLCSALTYTLLVLSVALLGRGQVRGREGVVRALLAGGIMVAPSLGNGTYAVLNAPDHTGTGVPVIVMLLLLDRLDRSTLRRWLSPLLLVLLVWVQVADSIAVHAVAIPIALVGAIRTGTHLVRRRSGAGSDEPGWHDPLLCVAALASVPLTAMTLVLLRGSGGFYLHPYPGRLLTGSAAWPGQARVLGQCLLTLFGADPAGHPLGLDYGLALLHMAGVAVAALGLLAGIRGFFGRIDRVSQILVVSVLVMLAAAQFSTAMTTILSVREIVIVLPVSAALAGRVVGSGLVRIRMSAVLGVVLAGYLAALGYAAAQPAVPAENQALADWLRAHDLRYGLAGYWQANSVTLDSSGEVRIAPIFGISPYEWESRPSWYVPRLSDPNFVVTVSYPQGEEMFAKPAVVRRVFGRSARVYRFQRYTILVWNKNLLNDLGPPPLLPPAMTIAAPPARPAR